MKKTYHGSCHCGAVRFEAELDLAQPTNRCNCSICYKTRFWKAIALPREFRVTRGEDDLVRYGFGSGDKIHHFCPRCGVKPFGRGTLEGLGPFVAVNVACLDDATDEELAAAPVVFTDGRNDDFEHAPALTSHL